MSAIHQFVPMLHRDDAVGRHTLRLRDVLKSRGIESRIYVEMIDPETEAETRLFSRYADDAQRGDVLLYQFATASAIASWLTERRETLAVNYHNVTPPEYYAAWNNPMARHQLRALHERANLAPRTSLAIAVSAFNEAELRSAGYTPTAVVPPAAIAPTTDAADPDADAETPGTAERPAGAGPRWICVGRVAPNKGIELALMALLVARAHHDPDVTLQVVGRPVVPAYTRALQRFAAELGLRDAVTFRGGISDPELVAAMAHSDVLIMASRHEGFGVPVIEAMTMGLPVVANGEGALPEVIGDAGVLVDATDPYALADAAACVATDAALRRSLADAGQRRVEALDLPSAGDRAVDLIAALAR
jgi:glycosyltransferase involved in cell wall biosynthesis